MAILQAIFPLQIEIGVYGVLLIGTVATSPAFAMMIFS